MRFESKTEHFFVCFGEKSWWTIYGQLSWWFHGFFWISWKWTNNCRLRRGFQVFLKFDTNNQLVTNFLRNYYLTFQGFAGFYPSTVSPRRLETCKSSWNVCFEGTQRTPGVAITRWLGVAINRPFFPKTSTTYHQPGAWNFADAHGQDVVGCVTCQHRYEREFFACFQSQRHSSFGTSLLVKIY